MIVQVNGGFDVPDGATVISPAGSPLPELKALWQLGIRIIFYWRHYL
jgi:hypothetical protein